MTAWLAFGCSTYDADLLRGDPHSLHGSGGESMGGASNGQSGTDSTGAAGSFAGAGGDEDSTANAGGSAGSTTSTGGAGSAGAGGAAGASLSTGGAAGVPDSAGGAAGTSVSTGGAAGTSANAGGAAGTLANNGGSSGNGGNGGGAPATLELIDDMEDNNSTVRFIKSRDGRWDTSNDGTPAATQDPPPGSFLTMKALAGDAPHAGDDYAAYTKGSIFSTWGAFMNVSMRAWPDYNATPTYDVSGYAGLSFYAKVGAGSTKAIRVRFVSADTDQRGGQCQTTGPTDTRCYDHFLSDVLLSTTWSRYEIRWSEFHQTGVGKSFPAIDLAHLYSLEFFLANGQAFEVWIDDLSFIVR